MRYGGNNYFNRKLSEVLASRYLPIVLASLAIVLALPSLWVNFVGDDFFHRMILKGLPEYPYSPPPQSIFTFVDGNVARTRFLMDHGLLPWWTFEELKISFWRPLAVLSHRLDYLVWPDLPMLMHAHNILWFGALVAATAVLYRQLIKISVVAGLAGLLYAIDDLHGFSVGWLATRNALMAAFFGTLALIAHVRWRRDGQGIGALLGPLFLVLGLLSAEAAIATVAYLFSHALFLDQGKLRTRLSALLPYGMVTLIWRLLYNYLGYGVYGSGYYQDPLREPLGFIYKLFERAPALLFLQWGFPNTTGSNFFNFEEKLASLCILAFLALMVLVLLPLIFRDALARFWGLAIAVSLLIACSATPSERNLFFVGLGSMGLIAQFLCSLTKQEKIARSKLSHNNCRAYSPPPWMIMRFYIRVMIYLLVAFHIVLAPLFLPIRASSPAIYNKLLIVVSYSAAPMDPAVVSQDLVILNMKPWYISIIRSLYGWPVPAHIRHLGLGELQSLQVTRIDARTLAIRQKGGYKIDHTFRGVDHPMLLGHRVELTGMTAKVTALTDDGRPAEVTFRFTVPLEDPSLRWIIWKKEKGFVPFPLPDIGQTIK